jgi:hypothetical protein
MEVVFHPAARAELDRLRESDPDEYASIQVAVEKLRTMGDRLPYPHSSSVRGASKLRELRPRSGSSRSRAFYRRIGAVIVIGAIGPEAKSDPRGFRRAIANAEERLAETRRDT